MTQDARALAEVRDQALRDLADLRTQVAAGELTEAEAKPMRLRYERRAADAIAALTAVAAGVDGSSEPSSAAEDGLADHVELSNSSNGEATDRAPRRRGPWRNSRMGLRYGLAAVVVVVAAAAALLPTFVGNRPPGGYATGNEVRVSLSTTPVPSLGRDLSKVSDAEMERVIAANPDVPGMRLALAQRYVAEGRYEQAITHYLAVLKLDPGSAEAQAGLAWVLFQAGRPDQALPIVDRALQRAPDLQLALWTTANILLYAGSDPVGALDLIRRMERLQLSAEVRKQVGELAAVAEARRRSGG